MNLYKLHANPEELDFYDEAHEKVPILIWKIYKNNPAELKKREDIIAKDAGRSYWYADEVLRSPFPKGEEVISKDAHYSCMYATFILKAPWSKGEDAIAENAYCSYQYAYKVLKLSDEEAKAWASKRVKA
jgi:lambda repressor-like predicted transcriptional regulator